MIEEPTLAVVRVDRDTVLPFGGGNADAQDAMVASTRVGNTALATPGTPMPAARVRLLTIDSATRANLAAAGITDSQPTVYLRAAPYGPDCRTIRWTDTAPFVVAGEVAFTRLTLLPREQWVRNDPVFTSRSAWYIPGSRRQRLFYEPESTPPAPADAVFALEVLLDRREQETRGQSRDQFLAAERARLVRAMNWARANPLVAELEPVRYRLRAAVVNADWDIARQQPSRFRGTYRVEIDANGARHAWHFRTQPQLAYRWTEIDATRTTRDLLASPHISGYSLVGYAAEAEAGLDGIVMRPPNRSPLVWLSVGDRPTAPGTDARRTMPGVLEFMLGATSEATWDMLEPFARTLSPLDSMMMTRMGHSIPRKEQQRRIPLTLHYDGERGVRADTTFVRDGRRLRVTVVRIDTMTVARLF